MTKFNQKRTIGSVFKVNLGDGYHSYGQVLNIEVEAFFNIRTKEELKLEEIINKEILFIISVHKHAFNDGRWKIIGKGQVKENLKKSPPFFLQHPLDKNKMQIYEDGAFRPALKKEIKCLERLAVWDANHVEDRLRDHFAGKENIWLNQLKFKE